MAFVATSRVVFGARMKILCVVVEYVKILVLIKLVVWVLLIMLSVELGMVTMFLSMSISFLINTSSFGI